MKVKIELTKQGPTFWMLGDPPNLLVHLSTFDKGPEEVEFSTLDPKFQNYILISLKSGYIKTNISFEELRSQMTVENKTNQQVLNETEKQVTEETEKQFDFFEKQERKREKDLKRVTFLLSRTTNAIMSGLAKEKESRFVRLLLEHERKTKNRKTVVKHLEFKIESIERALVKKLNKSYIKVVSPKKETSSFDVIESDEELIEISTEVLAGLAAGVY